MPKVLTVVVPTYNMEPFLDSCLSSFVLDEKYMDMLEILIVNDGSKDRSLEIGLGFETRFPGTYRVIDKTNGNYGSCINRGLAEATGKYFRILDADDWFDKNALARFLDILAHCDSDLIITPFNFRADRTELFTFSKSVILNEALPIETVSPDDIVHRMHSMTFSLDILKSVRLHLSEGVSYTDTEYCFFPLPSVKTILFIDECVYQYNAQREGQTCSPDAMVRSTRSMFVVTKRLLQAYLESNLHVQTVAGEIQRRLLVQITQMYYETSLLFCSSEDDPNLKEVDGLVRRIPFLDMILDKRCRHHIHYVRMWRKSGKRYSSSRFCQFHDSIWEKKH